MEIGKLKRHPKITDIWEREEKDFTPWLSQPENLSILAEALGFGPDGLEFEGAEVALPNSGYHADLLARVTGSATQERVLIENQFGESNHDHLGKLITYASGLSAKTVILIGEKIRLEHRAALDWLNSITHQDHHFFACEIELWKIGESPPAPHFKLVVQPNDWRRENTFGLTATTEGQKRQLRFWTLLEERLGKTSKRVRPVKPQPANWIVHSLGRTGCQLSAAVKFAENWVRGEIYLTGPNARTFYDQLYAKKGDIEKDFGAALDWYDAAEYDRRISLRRVFPMLSDEAHWKEAVEWLAATLDRLHAVFAPLVKGLKAEGDEDAL